MMKTMEIYPSTIWEMTRLKTQKQRMWQEDRTELDRQKTQTGITHHCLADLVPILLPGKEVDPGLPLVTLKGMVDILEVDQETILGLQWGRGNLVALVPEVAPEIEMGWILAVVQDHVKDTPGGPVQTVVIKLETEEHIKGLIHNLDRALVIEEEVSDLVHVPGTDIAHVPETDIANCSA